MAYMGTVLRVNLTSGSITTETFPRELARKYIGGRGLATKMLSDEVDPKVDPLAPENKLFFATGPLTNTSAPTGGRYMVITKSPLTGLVASSNSGGYFGARMKKAGYDIIVFEGKSEKPVYLVLGDDKVELRDAGHVWGKGVWETTDILEAEVGQKNSSVSCIGPAGETLSFMASIHERQAPCRRTQRRRRRDGKQEPQSGRRLRQAEKPRVRRGENARRR
jgi:aldehyde:ferredoxin oxidoreductase